MTTLHRTNSSPRRNTAMLSASQSPERRANHRGVTKGALAESANRRHRRFAAGADDDGRGAPHADDARWSSPDGDGGRREPTVAPTRPAETAWENIDKDGCGGQSPWWSEAEIEIRRRADAEASAADDDAMQPTPSEEANARIGGWYPGNTDSTD